MKQWKKQLENTRGFTLVELLAVIVILGIIAAIAVPSIGNVIDNSNRDAHISNAQSIKEAARLFNTVDHTGVKQEAITLQELLDEGYIEEINPPGDKETYDAENTLVDFEDGEVTLADSVERNYFSGNPDSAGRDDVTLNP